MNNRVLTLSLAMGFIAAYFVYSYVSSIEDEAKRKFGTQVIVVTAKRDIKEMETINETMLDKTPIPKKFLEPAAIYFEGDAPEKESNRGIKSLVGSVALVPIRKSEQVSYNKLTEPNMRTGLAPQIAPGRRAISIPVGDVSGVSKLVKPGDRIDLIAIVQAGSGKESRIAKTILQDTVVLATGRAVTNNVARLVEADSFGGPPKVRNLSEDSSFSTVTLEVEPAQAQMLALITTNTENQLMISLRNNDDTDRVALNPVNQDDALGPDAARYRLPAGSGGPGGRR